MSSSPIPRHQKPTKRTYGSSNRLKSFLPSSPRSTASWTASSPVRSSPLQDEKENKDETSSIGSYDISQSTLFNKLDLKRKASALYDEIPVPRKTLDAFFSASSTRPAKRPKLRPRSSATKDDLHEVPLVQMHLALSSKPIVRTCPTCNLSYTLGTPEDEGLHKRHHARVVAGIEWGKAEEASKGVEVVEEGVVVGKGKEKAKGRVLAFEGSCAGRLKAKLDTLLETVNTELTAPSLSPETLAASKIFIFVLPSGTSAKEKVVGCVVAQRIDRAMRVVASPSTNDDSLPDTSKAVMIDSDDGGLYCDPTPLPTPLGISRLWTSAQHRKKGIASVLLNAGCRRTVYGCELDPEKGQVAFSQPTNSGRGIMMRWGKGGCRIFTEN
ncbi:hypothetical protein CALCODRAFT_501377 [Calocera cornea HHB12733]|uniref:N-acetyltransferase ECO1 n=1 Tax=Calocera cornea HHB12733 TaxID=1353952 RepID=A0A165DNA7_9BASI|nr:hypothetical protein CALCODRAFT_501377 [Calocera cornea HHB12733]